MNDLVDMDTGEIATVSEAALHARAAAEQSAMKVHQQLAEALEAAVAEMPVWITQDAKVAAGALKYKYATLKTILVTVRPILLKHGIRIRQGTNPSWTLDGGGIKGRLVPVYTDLIHSESGQMDRTIVEIPVTKLDAQAMGSALMYGRRYSLVAALGLATDEADDDGAATKTASITDEHEESQLLWTLKSEIAGFDDMAKLTSWGDKLKATRRADDLSEGELALLKQHYREAMHKLSQPKEKAGKKAATNEG
jgi:hypothetical protein